MAFIIVQMITYKPIPRRTVSNLCAFLNVIDEYSRDCLAIRAERRLTHFDVLKILKELFVQGGVPVLIRSDNWAEFTAKRVGSWMSWLQIKPLLIEPGSPWEYGYIESFNEKVRDEQLNGEIIPTLKETRVLIVM